MTASNLTRRHLLAASVATSTLHARRARPGERVDPVLVGSANALRGMRESWEGLAEGGHPLDAAISTVKVVEADPDDSSVGLGGQPNEDGCVQLEAACMDGETHNSGAVGALENILHPCEVARLVMERTDHCQIFGEGAYRFARSYGHPHTELLTESSRRRWIRWRESMSDRDDRLQPRGPEDEKHGSLELPSRFERHGTIHCSALSARGQVACTTTTSGLAWKIPGRVGDSPIIGAGLYCDGEVGSAGSTGRGEAAILSCGSHTVIELMRQGMHPKDAGLELMRRIVRQTERLAKWQPGLMGEDGKPAFNISFYVLDTKGRSAGVRLKGHARYAVADVQGGPRQEVQEPLFE